jgi:glycosyltransferase involved in cell wall biosynthesis
MKICMIISTPFPPKEGIGYYTYNLSKKLIEKGHEVIVITRGSWNKIQRQVIEDIDVIRVPFVPIYPFYLKIHGIFVNKVLKSLESQIDIVHIHSPLPPFVKTSHPMITTVHTPMLTDFRQVKIKSFYSLFSKISARFISFPLEKKLIQSSNIITTVSKSVAQELKEFYSESKSIDVVENGVDEKFFCPKKEKTKENIKYGIFVGRIDREKGLFDLVECGKYICKERPEFYFIIAGKGRDLKNLKNKAKKVGLQDKFIFLGQVDKENLVKLYQDATLFIFPSYHEGLPSVVLEAMSCGLPIIATDVRGNRDLITHKENGIIIPPREPKKIAEAINMLLGDEKLMENLGKNARDTIIKRYTWDIATNKMLKCYKSLLELQT